MHEQSACWPESHWYGLPIGRGEIDNEAGIEQPSASTLVMPLISTNDISHDLVRGLFDDVRGLKRTATDFTRRASEIEQLRSELNDMKLKVDLLAASRSENVQDGPQPPTVSPLAGEPSVPVSLQVQGARGFVLKAMTLQSREAQTTRSSSASGATSKDSSWFAQMGTPTALNAPGRKQARRTSISDGGSLYSGDGRSLDFWEFKHSCWDVASLLGHRQSFGALEALANALLLSINTIVQVLLIFILFRLADTTFDDATIEGFHKWRTVTGHAVQYLDQLTEESLATRVCYGDTSLHVSNSQSVQVANINTYLRRHAPFNGPMMCLLALLIWMLTVSKELHELMSMLRACMNLPRGQTVISAQNSGLQLCSLSSYRLIYITLLAAIRTVIAGCLLVAGVRFLIVTTAIEDILLNTVALEFILEIDELLFNAWAPRQTRMLVLWMNPLPVMGRSWKGLDTDLFAILFIVFSAFSVAVPIWLLPEMQRMRRAEEALCGGLVGFSYAESKVNFVVWATESLHTSPGQAWQVFKGSSRYNTLRSIIENRYESDSFATNVKVGSLRGAVESVEGLHAMDIQALGAVMNPGCRNIVHGANATRIDVLHYAALTSIRDSLGNQSVSSCDEVAVHCNSLLHAGVRMMCPKTCGCDIPSSALAFAFPDFGCPDSCLYKPSFAAALTAQPCVDQPKHVLAQDASWQQLAINFRQGAASLPAFYQQMWDSVSTMMVKNGCGIIAKVAETYPTIFSLNLCDHEWKPLQFWCPVTCNCSSTRPFPNVCPKSC